MVGSRLSFLRFLNFLGSLCRSLCRFWLSFFHGCSSLLLADRDSDRINWCQKIGQRRDTILRNHEKGSQKRQRERQQRTKKWENRKKTNENHHERAIKKASARIRCDGSENRKDHMLSEARYGTSRKWKSSKKMTLRPKITLRHFEKFAGSYWQFIKKTLDVSKVRRLKGKAIARIITTSREISKSTNRE